MATVDEQIIEAREFIQKNSGDLPFFHETIERELERLVALAILHGEKRGLEASREMAAKAGVV